MLHLSYFRCQNARENLSFKFIENEKNKRTGTRNPQSQSRQIDRSQLTTSLETSTVPNLTSTCEPLQYRFTVRVTGNPADTHP